MPEIPFRSAPPFQGGGNSFIPFSMPFNYPRINIHDQDQIWRGAAAIADTASSTVFEFQSKLQKAEDYNNIEEARRLAKTSYDGYLQELHLRNDPENFNKGLDEVNKKVQQQLADKFGGRASEKANMQIKNSVADMYAEANLHATGVSNQKRVETLQADSLSRVDAHLKIGDLPSAKKEIDNGVKLGWYSQAKARQLLDDSAERSSFFQLSDKIRTGDPAQIAVELEKKDAKGLFTMYPELQQERRSALINQAKEQQKFQARQFMTNVEMKQYDGTLSVMELDTAVKRGWVPPDTGMRIKKELLDPNKPVPFNSSVFSTLSKAEYDYIQSNQTQADRDAYLKAYNDNYTLLPKENRDHFRNVMEGFNKQYEEKLTARPAFKAAIKLAADAHNDDSFYVDPSGLWNKKKDKETQLIGWSTSVDEFTRIFKSNPDMSPEESTKIMSGLIKDYQNGKVIKGYSRRYKDTKSGNSLYRDPVVSKDKRSEPLSEYTEDYEPKIINRGKTADGKNVVLYDDGRMEYAK